MIHKSFSITEWDWFKIQLRLSSLETKGLYWLTVYSFDENTSSEISSSQYKVVCKIYNSKINDILNDVENKKQLFNDYFLGWITIEKERISQILADLPYLRKELDLESDVSFEIRKDNIISGYMICSIIGDHTNWNPNFEIPIR